MRALLVLMTLLLTLMPSAAAVDRSLADLREDNALLQAEYSLVQAGKPCLLIDLQARQLQLKASGLILASWRIDSFRRWGRPSAVPAAKLERKTSFAEPEREVQVVNAAEPDDSVAGKIFKALELADMPAAYRLLLDNGTVIAVRPSAAGGFDRLRNAFAAAAWSLSRPLISLWNFLAGRPYNELLLAMTERDARMLYWAFSEGTSCLIRPPAAGALLPERNGHAL